MPLSVAALSKLFPVYSSFNTSLASAWIVSNPNTNSIHRFFDSSPFSPNNRYIAFTELPSPARAGKSSRELGASSVSDFATVVLVDLRSGQRTEVGKTLAWDSQVGAHVQWGDNDGTLYYNSFGENLPYDHENYCGKLVPNFRTQAWPLPVGVAYNTYTGEKKVKNCPIYHISPDGSKSASPNLFKIGHTQKGYGIPIAELAERHETKMNPYQIDWLAGPNRDASMNDGLTVCTMRYDICYFDKSLYHLVKHIGLDTTSTPVYGFHTKWSPDSRLVMFVVRTMEKPAPLQSRWYAGTPKRKVRVQHLFVVEPQGGEVKHVTSWASKPYISAKNGVVYPRDGNHPNWIPCTLYNGTTVVHFTESGYRAGRSDSPLCESYKISMNQQAKMGKRKELPHWQIVEFDVSKYFPSHVASHHMQHSRRHRLNETVSREKVVPRVVYDVGSGHPTYSYNTEGGRSACDLCGGSVVNENSGRFVVTDAYEKEKEVLEDLMRVSTARAKQSGSSDSSSRRWKAGPGEVPLRLIDLKEKREVTLLTMNIARTKRESTAQSLIYGVSALFGGAAGGSKKDNSWRCDMHPAWSRDYQWLAINGIPNGDNRQVIIVHVGENMSTLF